MYFDWHWSTSLQFYSRCITYISWHSYPFFQNIKMLGVTLDKNLTLHKHISMFPHYCMISISTPAHSVTLGLPWRSLWLQLRVDYDNSIMYGMSSSNMHKLQSAQNSLSRVVLPSLHHFTASEWLSLFLHWLPVHYRTQFKTATATLPCELSLITTHVSDCCYIFRP